MEVPNTYDLLSPINGYMERKEIPISVRSRRSNHQYPNKLESNYDPSEKYALKKLLANKLRLVCIKLNENRSRNWKSCFRKKRDKFYEMYLQQIVDLKLKYINY